MEERKGPGRPVFLVEDWIVRLTDGMEFIILGRDGPWEKPLEAAQAVAERFFDRREVEGIRPYPVLVARAGPHLFIGEGGEA